jgi:hypothetical protein
MGRREGCADLVRLVRGERGRVDLKMELVIRCEYGSIVPWVRRLDDDRLTAVARSDRLTFAGPVKTHGENLRTIAEFSVGAGEEIPFALTWSPSFHMIPPSADAADTIEEGGAGWCEWANSYKPEVSGEWSEAVLRSLITLKALTHRETGGIVAAATTLPEHLGGTRNWDYRFCWLRDATLTLYALLNSVGKKSVPGAGPKLSAAGRTGWRAVLQLPVSEVRWCAASRIFCRKLAAWLKPLAIRIGIMPPRLLSAEAKGQVRSRRSGSVLGHEGDRRNNR